MWNAWLLFAVSVGAVAALAGLIIAGRHRERLGLALLIGLTLLMLLRWLVQVDGGAAVGRVLVPGLLVPLGFGLVVVHAVRPGRLVALAFVGAVLVALARTWFAFHYLEPGVYPIALANLPGALGAWVWATAYVARTEDRPRGLA